jgi:hypothetical protein
MSISGNTPVDLNAAPLVAQRTAAPTVTSEPAADPPKTVIKTYTYKTDAPKQSYTYTYPQVSNLAKDPDVGRNINRKLEAFGMPTAKFIADNKDFMTKNEPTSSYEQETQGTVGMIGRGLISTSYSTYSEAAWAAHPNSDIQTLTLDTTTGKEVQLKDLLKPGAMDKLKALALKQVQETFAKSGDVYPGPESAFQDGDPKFYLSKGDKGADMLVLPSIYDAHALAGVDAELPIGSKELQDLVKPDGPLKNK